MRRALDTTTAGVALAALVVLLLGVSEFGRLAPRFYGFANLAVLVVFVADVAVRILVSPDRRAHLRQNWLDLIVLLPLLQHIGGVHRGAWSVLARQTAIVVMLLTRTRRVKRLFSSFTLKPAQLMALTFLGAIYAGTVLLMLPAASRAGEQMRLVDALFTATSATCVTGLIVADTATHFSTFGQLVILVLIQVGGLGIMTFSVSLALLAGRDVGLKQRAALQDMMDYDTLAGVRRLVLFVVGMTAVFETIGSVALFVSWRAQIPEVGARLYHASFHAVSAFCNAGFSTFSDSLMRFDGHAATNVSVCVLIVCGGLGFTVFKDFVDNVRVKLSTPGHQRWRLRTQTKLVLSVSLCLICIGAVLLAAFERHALLDQVATPRTVCVPVFQSITARTAGFNTCDIGRLSSASLFLMMVLMFIGASPGSTGGGIKTTTAAVLWTAVVTNLRRREHAEVFRRTLPLEVIQKAVTVLVLSATTVVVFTVLLLSTEQKPLRDVLFEVISAFATVGLSTGITPELTVPGRLLVTVLMFVGRLGPLTVAYSLLRFRRPANYAYAEERVMVG